MKKGYFSVGTAALLSLGLFTNSFAVDACNDAMGHSGNGTNVNGNSVGKISGTPWGFEQWYQGGTNSMTYYSNGTFKATWSGSSDYLARVGFQYTTDANDISHMIDHKTKHLAVDYKYTKTSQNAAYGYIGVYGWTRQPDVEYYIVDDWYSQPSEDYIGPKFGEITVDGGTYTIHAFIRDGEPSKMGDATTFLQIFSVRKTARQCGHIDISAHFNKWEELFHGQTENLPTSKKGRKDYQVGFGKLMEVMLMNEAGGGASGSVDYTYFNMVDNAEGSSTTSSASTNPTSSASTPTSSAAQNQPSVGTLPGTIEFEDYQSTGGADLTKNGTTLGSINPGAWVEFGVDVSYTGTYEVEVLAARKDADGNKSNLTISIDGKDVGSISDILTDDWSDFKPFTGTTTNIDAGKHTLRVTFDYGWLDVDNIKFTAKEVNMSSKYEPPTSSASAPASSGSVAPASNGSTTPASNGSNPANNGAGNEAPEAIGNIHMSQSTMDMQVFDVQGRNLGRVRVNAGASLEETLFAKFHKSGIYLVKQGSQLTKVRVIR